MFRIEPEIVKVENTSKMMEQILNKLNPHEINSTIVLFDLDLTVIDRIIQIMSDLHGRERKEFLVSLEKEDPSLVEIAYAQSPYKLIEKNIANCINELIEKGLIVLGYTSRRTGKPKAENPTTVEEDTCIVLQQFGIQFSNIPKKEFDIPKDSVPLENPHLRPYEVPGKPQIFGDTFGISTVFTANYPKGMILEDVIKYLAELKPEIKITRVIGVDDNLDYLKNLKDTCDKNNLNFFGLHYTFAHDHKQELNPSIVAIQKEHLINHRELLSDEDALKILENKQVAMARTI